MRMFEIYVYKDQVQKTGDGGHVRFVAGKDERSARHKVAFEWGHWWRTCGIREVTIDHWQVVHSNLDREGVAYVHSQQAYKDYFGNQGSWKMGASSCEDK